MRRRDVLTLIALGGLAFYAWQQLKPPAVVLAEGPADPELISKMNRWSGPIEKALELKSASASGEVKGVSTEPLSPAQKPQSLLPVETYSGSPFLKTLSAQLEAASVTINPEDVVEVWPEPSWGLGSTITIYRAHEVIVSDWGKEKSYRTWAKSVGAFLAEQAIELGDNDRIEPNSNTNIKLEEATKEAKVIITRVAITELKVEEKIDFKKKQTDDPELPRGQKKVTKGAVGLRTKKFRVTRENGVEVKRELLSNEVTKEPKDELTIVGTKVVIGKSFTGRASWYKYNSTKVATDNFKRGVNLRITNLDNGKVIFVKNDGCICADTGFVVDLHPDHFTALGGVIRDGVMKRVQVDEVLN